MQPYSFEPVDNQRIVDTAFTELLLHHARCDRQQPPPPLRVQSHLSNENGYLGLSQIHPRAYQRCTPAPHAVRRIANAPTFSTNNPAHTSFLRFPAEIRLQIYSLLLIAEGIIKYDICPVKLCLVLRDNLTRQLYFNNDNRRPRPLRRPYIRNGIFPSILRCCRLIYREGVPILYGQNTFAIEKVTFSPQYYWESRVNHLVVSSFHLHATNFENITKIQLMVFRPWSKESFSLRNQLSPLALFPGLREARILCYNAEPDEAKDLVEQVIRDGLLRFKICFELRISCSGVEWMDGSGDHLKEFFGEALDVLKKHALGIRRAVEVVERYEDVEDSEYYWGLFKGMIQIVVK